MASRVRTAPAVSIRYEPRARANGVTSIEVWFAGGHAHLALAFKQLLDQLQTPYANRIDPNGRRSITVLRPTNGVLDLLHGVERELVEEGWFDVE